MGGLAFLPLVGAVLGGRGGATGLLAVASWDRCRRRSAAVGVVGAVRGTDVCAAVAPFGVRGGRRRHARQAVGRAAPARRQAARRCRWPACSGAGRSWSSATAAARPVWGLAAQLVGRARLREFGWASALAFGATLAALDAVGLVVLLAADARRGRPPVFSPIAQCSRRPGVGRRASSLVVAGEARESASMLAASWP